MKGLETELDLLGVDREEAGYETRRFLYVLSSLPKTIRTSSGLFMATKPGT